MSEHGEIGREPGTPADPPRPAPQAGSGVPPTPAPIFSAPRRAKGPDRKFTLVAILVVVAIGVSVGAWLKFGGGSSQGGSQGDVQGAAEGDESALVAAVDSAESALEGEDSSGDAPPAVVDDAVEEAVAEAVEPETALETVIPVRLSVTVEPRAATVWVDGTPIADLDLDAGLPPGQYMLHAEAESYLPLDVTIDLTSDTSVALVLTPATGTLGARANIAGRVLVNGRDRGAAPLRGLALRPGTYTVRFVPQAGDALAQQKSARIVAGESVAVSFEVTDALISVGVRQPRWATVYAGDVRLGDTPLIEHVLPARAYQVRVAREGYLSQERLVRLEPGQKFEWVDIVLEEGVRP